MYISVMGVPFSSLSELFLVLNRAQLSSRLIKKRYGSLDKLVRKTWPKLTDEEIRNELLIRRSNLCTRKLDEKINTAMSANSVLQMLMQLTIQYASATHNCPEEIHNLAASKDLTTFKAKLSKIIAES